MLNVIQSGYKIQLINANVSLPHIKSNPSKANKSAIQQEINSLLASGAISKTFKQENDIVSRIFLVKKKNGKNRLILDLSSLNLHIVKTSFKMEDRNTIISLMDPNDFLISIDLKDAFHSVPLHPHSKRLTCFDWENQRFLFNVLPFGLTSSPRIFSKILKPVISFLRNRNLKITFYLDDLLILSSSEDKALSDRDSTLFLLNSLGYTINSQKSNLFPSQILTHLGYIWNSCDMTISLPLDKISKIKNLARKCFYSPSSLRDLAALLGLLVSASNGFLFSPLHFRNFQLCFIHALRVCHSWDQIWDLSHAAKLDLTWWINCNPQELSPVPLLNHDPCVSLFSDASLSGWGASLSSGEMISGLWSHPDVEEHINFLELKAIYLSIVHFLPLLKGKSVAIRSDNSSSIFYINKMGGTHSPILCHLALKIWNLAVLHDIKIHASHIAGIDNSAADFLSRFSHHHEYELSPKAFDILRDIIPFSLNLDLFATKKNKKLNNYVSLFEDPDASYINAFSFPWPSNVYMFPPIPLIAKSVLKFARDNVNFCILITPAWHSLAILPVIEKFLICSPIFIPQKFLIGCLPTRHSFSLMAWPISRNTVRKKAFQKLSQMPSCKALTQPLLSPIQGSGRLLLLGLMAKNLDPIFLPS